MRFTNAIKYYFLSLSLTPVLAFVFYSYLDIYFIYFIGSLGVLLTTIYFFFNTQFRFPGYLNLAVLTFFYYFTWDIVHDSVNEEGGLLIYLYKNLYFHIIFILLLIENTEFGKQDIALYTKIFKITILAAFLVSLIQFLINPLFFTPLHSQSQILTRVVYNIRFTSVFGFVDSRELGMSFIPLLALVISQSILKKDRFLYFWIVFGGIVAFINNSRWVQLNFLVITYLLIIYRKISWRNYVLVLTSFFVILYLVLLIGGFNIELYLKERLFNETALSRFLAWEMFERFFPSNPFFGTGQRLTDELVRALEHRSSQIHVGYLSHLFEYGLVGSILAFWFWSVITRRFLNGARLSQDYGPLLAFICFLVTNLTLVDYSIFRYGLIFAFIFNKYNSAEKVKSVMP